MSERRWTPGPWELSGISLNTGSISIRQPDLRIVIADVTNAASFGDFVGAALRGQKDFGAPDTAITQHANAHLIAAAPDLYDALTEANAFILAPAEDIHEHVLSRIRAALLHAKGEQG